MSKLSENFGGEFIITGEIAPPKGPDISEFLEEIEEFKNLMGKLHGVNVVDIPGARLLMSSLSASIMLKQNGVDPIYQLVCRDRNRLALEADLIGASAFGIENVLSLTGDHPESLSSDHPKAKCVFDLDSSSLVKAMKMMNQGKDIANGDLNKPTNFFIGAALAPGAKPIDGEIYKTKRKIECGVDFFQTQAVFDSSLLQDFLNRYDSLIGGDIKNKIMMGIVPLYSFGMVKFLRTMPGIFISEETGNRIKNAKDPVEEGISIAADLIEDAKSMGLAGVHLMPAGKIEALVRLLENL